MSLNKLIIGAALGIAAGYAIARMQEKGLFEEVCDEANDLFSKTKKKVKDVVDMGENQLEYAKDRLQYKANQAEEKFRDFNNQEQE